MPGTYSWLEKTELCYKGEEESAKAIG